MIGNHDAACMDHTSASTLGRSYALYFERVVFLLYVVWCSSSYLFGRRAKRHSFGIYFSLHPVRMGLPLDENTVTSRLENKTVQSASHTGLTPTRVFVQYAMIYPVVGKYAVKCRIGIVAVDDDLSTCTVSVTTLIGWALVLRGLCCAVGGMYRWVAP